MAARTNTSDVVVRGALATSAVAVLLATVAMLAFLGHAGIRGVASVGLGELVTTATWKPEIDRFGGLSLLFGTFASAAGAVVLGGVPAIVSAIWATELAPKELAALHRRAMEIVSAVPSVVYGWLALVHLVPAMGQFARVLDPQHAGGGEGIASASVLLAAMIAPTVTLLSLDAIARVPRELRDASAALGASGWQTTMRVVVPHAWRGIMIAIFFGFARAAGETMAVQMVIGGARKLPEGAFSPTTTISTQIVMDMQNARPGTPPSDVLFSMSLVLLLVSVSVVLLTRALARRGAR